MTTTTTNMSLILPDVSLTVGPTWASMLNAALLALDSHSHASGSGVRITPSAINISSDLTFASNNATNLRSLRLFNNSSFTAGVNDRTCFYTLNNELYFIDGAGNLIQVTLGGSLNLGASITGLTLNDSTFFLRYFGDTTKQIRFNASQIPTATTRIFSLPDPGANDTLVSLISTQLLTNKTFDATSTMTGVKIASLTPNGSNTITFPAATDTVVTLAASQTLTNKVLSGNSMANVKPDGVQILTLPIITDTLVTKSTTDILTNKTLTGAVITDYEDFTNVAAPATPAAGKLRVYSKTDNRVYKKDSSGIEVQVGSGTSSSINYISNPDFEDGTVTGWATYADAAGTTPVDGTGGSPTVTFANSSTTPLRGTYSGLFTKDAANRQGEGVAYAFTLSAADVSKTLQITFDSTVSSGTFASGDLTVYVYDITNGILITPSSINVPTGLASQYSLCFQATTSLSYRLILHCASTSSSAYTLRFDQVSISPIVRPLTTGLSDWIAYTPTLSAGFGTPSAVAFYYRREGDSMRVSGTFTSGTTTSAIALVTLPGSFLINSTKIPLNATAVSSCQIVGHMDRPNPSGSVAANILVATATSTSQVYFSQPQAATVNKLLPAAANTIIGGSEIIVLEFLVPIVQWSSNITLASTTPAIEYVYNTSTADSADTTSFGSGASGTVGIIRTTALTAQRLKRVQFSNPIQPTDRIVIEIDVGGTGQWSPVESAAAFSGTNLYGSLSIKTPIASLANGCGMGWKPVSGSLTQLDICFNRYVLIDLSGGGYDWNNTSLIAGTKWRVAKYSSIGAAELAPATSLSSGTISRENVWTAYTPTLSAGFGTATAINFFYKVLGDSLFVRGLFVTGTVAASAATISLPAGFTISSAKIPNATAPGSGPIIGQFTSNQTTNAVCTLLAMVNTSTSIVYVGGNGNTTSPTISQNGNANTGSSAACTCQFEVPIV